MDDNVLQKLHPCIVVTVSIYSKIIVVVVVAVFAFLLSFCSWIFWTLFGLDFLTFFLNHTTLDYISRDCGDRQHYSFNTPFCNSLFVNRSYNLNIQGKGFPDVNTRMMVRCLWSTLQIPILALVDADPHGNLERCSFFTLDGGVAISPPEYESLSKQFNWLINRSCLSLLCKARLCSWQILEQVKNVSN